MRLADSRGDGVMVAGKPLPGVIPVMTSGTTATLCTSLLFLDLGRDHRVLSDLHTDYIVSEEEAVVSPQKRDFLVKFISTWYKYKGKLVSILGHCFRPCTSKLSRKGPRPHAHAEAAWTGRTPSPPQSKDERHSLCPAAPRGDALDPGTGCLGVWPRPGGPVLETDSALAVGWLCGSLAACCPVSLVGAAPSPRGVPARPRGQTSSFWTEADRRNERS